MKLIVIRSASVGGLIVSAAVVMLAVTISIARMLVPLVADYRAEIQQELSTLLGREVRVGSVAGDWEGWAPCFTLNDVELYDRHRNRTLSIKAAHFTPDWLHSLTARRLHIHELSLIGVDLEIIRQANGVLVLRGLEGGRVISDFSPPVALLEHMNINLLESQVRIIDAVTDADYRFSGVNISVRSDGATHRLVADVTPPQDVASRITAVVHFRGRLEQPRGWRGRVYLNVRNLQAESLNRYRLGHGWGIEKGAVSLEAWSEWEAGAMVRLTGTVDVRHARFNIPGAHEGGEGGTIRFEHVGSRFEWAGRVGDWRLKVADGHVQAQGRMWPKVHASLAYRRQQAQRAVSGTISYLNLADLMPLLRWVPDPIDELPVHPQALDPKGDLTEVRFALRAEHDKVTQYAFEARFQDLGFAANSAFAGMSGADGWIRASDRAGQMDLDTFALQLHYPSFFSKPIFADQLSAGIHWRQGVDGVTLRAEGVRVRNEDLDLDGRALIRLGPGSPYLDLAFSLRDGNGAHVARYLPDKKIKPKVTAWLKDAIIDGHIERGEMVFQGYLADFPFEHGNGIFQAVAHVNDGVLRLKRGEPPLRDISGAVLFRNRSMHIVGDHARVLGLEIARTRGTIGNLKRADLYVTSSASGPMADIVQVLRAFHRLDDGARLLDDPELSGTGRLSLQVRKPLSRKIQAKASVDGRLQFRNAQARFRPFKLVLDSVNGVASFGPEGVSAEGIQARLQGQPVELSAEGRKYGATRVQLEGRFDVKTLFDGFEHPWLASLKGASLWTAQIDVPPLKVNPRTLGLRLSSDLQGTRIDLPAPFGKPADAQRRLTVATRFSRRGIEPTRIAYGSIASAILAMGTRQGGWSLERGELCFNEAADAVPDHGMRIRGTLDTLSLSQWWPWYEALREYSARSGGRRQSAPPSVNHIDLKVNHLAWEGHRVANLHVHARRLEAKWVAKVEAPMFKGDIQIPTALRSALPMVMTLDHVSVETQDAAVRLPRLDPRTLPAMRITSPEVYLNGRRFSDLHVETTRRADGIQVHNAQLAGRQFTVRATGDWRVRSHDEQQSNIRLVFNSEDFAGALSELDLAHSFDGGVADIEVNARWPDAPYRLDYQGLSGRAAVRIEKGRLEKIEPGAGRVIGLLNLSMLSRRLALDFSDLFEKGFAFDQITGHLVMVGSDVFTNDLEIEGPAADMGIVGRAGLKAHDYEQMITVTPQVGPGLPIAGAIVGGPAVGAAVFVAEKFLRRIGSDISKVTRFKYEVTGPWNDPVVRLLGPLRQEQGQSDEDSG